MFINQRRVDVTISPQGSNRMQGNVVQKCVGRPSMAQRVCDDMAAKPNSLASFSDALGEVSNRPGPARRSSENKIVVVDGFGESTLQDVANDWDEADKPLAGFGIGQAKQAGGEINSAAAKGVAIARTNGCVKNRGQHIMHIGWNGVEQGFDFGHSRDLLTTPRLYGRNQELNVNRDQPLLPCPPQNAAKRMQAVFYGGRGQRPTEQLLLVGPDGGLIDPIGDPLPTFLFDEPAVRLIRQDDRAGLEFTGGDAGGGEGEKTIDQFGDCEPTMIGAGLRIRTNQRREFLDCQFAIGFGARTFDENSPFAAGVGGETLFGLPIEHRSRTTHDTASVKDFLTRKAGCVTDDGEGPGSELQSGPGLWIQVRVTGIEPARVSPLDPKS